MTQFPVSPDDCLVLKAIRDARSLREAAKLLNCDPAGLHRKVQRIASEYGYLVKVRGRWALTATGQSLVAWLEECILSQTALLRSETSLRFVSTAWFAEEVLIPRLHALAQQFAATSKFSLAVPQRDFEIEILEGNADFAIVCHPPESPMIAHKQLGHEDWVVVIPAAWRSGQRKKHLAIDDLSGMPFIRHHQMNPDLVYPNLVSVKQQVMIDNLVGVRAAVRSGLGWSFVPRILVSKNLENREMLEIEHSLRMNRKICVWWLRNRSDSKKQAPIICAWVAKSVGLKLPD